MDRCKNCNLALTCLVSTSVQSCKQATYDMSDRYLRHCYHHNHCLHHRPIGPRYTFRSCTGSSWGRTSPQLQCSFTVFLLRNRIRCLFEATLIFEQIDEDDDEEEKQAEDGPSRPPGSTGVSNKRWGNFWILTTTRLVRSILAVGLAITFPWVGDASTDLTEELITMTLTGRARRAVLLVWPVCTVICAVTSKAIDLITFPTIYFENLHLLLL